MPANLWLIAEDDSDFYVIKQIFTKRGLAVTLRRVSLQSASGGIGELANQLSALIKTVRKKKNYKRTDCIVVFHDLDTKEQHVQNPKPYKAIERICRKEKAVRIVADDKIEAWMLADRGLCAWLEIKVKSWDENPHVKEELERALHKTHPNMRYSGPDRDKIIANLDGTGSAKSQSMQAAFNHLTEAACI